MVYIQEQSDLGIHCLFIPINKLTNKLNMYPKCTAIRAGIEFAAMNILSHNVRKLRIYFLVYIGNANEQLIS